MTPDFQEGFKEGVQAFREGIYFPEDNHAWSEEDIIRFVQRELSGTQYKRDKCINTAFGIEHLTYLHHLGFVVGYIHQALNAVA
jgi:hypothetical protein